MRKKTTFIFPDGEVLMVASLRKVLELAGEAGIRVGTKKATPQEEAENPQLRQIIVRSDGGVTFDRVGKEEDFGLNIFVKNENRNAGYAEANRLAQLLEALIPLTPGVVSGQLRTAVLNGVIAIETDTEEQQRYARASVVLQGTVLDL